MFCLPTDSRAAVAQFMANKTGCARFAGVRLCGRCETDLCFIALQTGFCVTVPIAVHVSLYRPNRADKVFIKFVLLCILCKFRNHGLNADCETHGQIEPFGYAAKHFIAVQRFLNTRFLRKVCVVDQCIDFDRPAPVTFSIMSRLDSSSAEKGRPCVHQHTEPQWHCGRFY